MNPAFTHIQPRPASAVMGVFRSTKRVATVLLRCCYGIAPVLLPCASRNYLQLLDLRTASEGGLALLLPHDPPPYKIRNQAYHSTLRTTARLGHLLNCLRRLVWSLDIQANPKGTASFSPGLRGTSYPGFKHRKNRQPCKGCLTAEWGGDSLSPQFQARSAGDTPSPPRKREIDAALGDRRSNPFRVDAPPHRTPRVARASQPWAERFHPFRMTADLARRAERSHSFRLMAALPRL